MITFASAVEIGDFVQIRQHRAQERYQLQWWRVTDKRSTGTTDTLELINRHGQRGRYTGQHVKVNKWTPGEDNRDRT